MSYLQYLQQYSIISMGFIPVQLPLPALTQLPFPSLLALSWSQFHTWPGYCTWWPALSMLWWIPKSFAEVPVAKGTAKSMEIPWPGKPRGEARHWNQPWKTTGWRRKWFLSDRQVGISGLTFYTTSLKGISWYSMFTVSIFIYVFKRCVCHKDIKQGKADHLQ